MRSAAFTVLVSPIYGRPGPAVAAIGCCV